MRLQLAIRAEVASKQALCLERVTRIELAFSAWEADVLPLNYTRGMAPEPSKSPGHGVIEPNSGLLVAGEFAVVTLA